MGMQGSMWSAIAKQGGATWELGLGLIGRAMAQKNYDEANRIYETILSSIAQEDVPHFKEMLAQEVPEADSILGRGEGRSAQSSALANLQSFVDQGGLDAQARAMNEEALAGADQRAQANRGAAMQQASRRGMSGSGGELVNMLQGNQNQANQARQSSLDIAGQARQRAIGALSTQAALGSTMRGQDIDVESKNSAAKQARDQFNAKMRYSAMGANNQLDQLDFQNRMSKSSALNNARMGQVKRLEQGGQQTQKDFSGVGKSINYKHQIAAEDLEDMPF
jgi:hypothetical protein